MALEGLQAYSDEFTALVDKVARSTVRVGNGDRSAGTGIVWAANGIILTANHVVARARTLHVQVDGATYDAEVIGQDAGTDLALLRIPANELVPAEIGDSKQLKVGNIVFALGHPWGQGLIVSAGIVSALGRPHVGRWAEQFREGLVQTNLQLYPGFSGGPLADASGRVVGINTSVVGGDLGVAIPSETLSRVAGQLAQEGHVKRGYLGLALQKVPLAPALYKLGVQQETGLLVLMVENGEAGEKAGVLPGDIVIGANGTPLPRMRDLRHWLDTPVDGQSVPLRIIRGGELKEVPLIIGAR